MFGRRGGAGRPGMVGAAVLTGAALMGAAGCSADDPPFASVSAGQICDGSLDASAAADLRALAKGEEFSETVSTRLAKEAKENAERAGVRHQHGADGKGGAGRGDADGKKPGTALGYTLFSLDRAARPAALHQNGDARPHCDIYRLNDKGRLVPVVIVNFAAERRVPDKKATKDAYDVSGTKYLSYPVGAAGFLGRDEAALHFRCGTGAGGDRTGFVVARMYGVQYGLDAPGTQGAMQILLSMSRHLADAAGCADEAGLPATVPKPEKAREARS
ncbi:hypothetical protein [Streptomyces sp. NPDC050560]|uniref:hypothetical protein n=1 Tax=Streptomyces sp. NPDC050560 TaxID=3365630 RepID=UPI0037ABE77E